MIGAAPPSGTDTESGRRAPTGVVSVTSPRRAISPSARAVTTFVTDPTSYAVCAVGAVPSESTAPLVTTCSRPSRTTATTTDGRSFSATNAATRASSESTTAPPAS